MRTILIKKNAVELAVTAAEAFVEIAHAAIAERGKFSVALSGGSTPAALYSLLAGEYRNRIPWNKALFFFGDERNVPPDSPESNYRMASETLLEPLGIEGPAVIRWQTELGATEAAAEYDRHMAAGGPHDLILLGLGSDGHTASLFPNSSALRETEKLAVANWIDKFNDFRLTMTFPAINRSTCAMFLVSGIEKAGAVRSVLEGEFRPDEYPAQMVGPEQGQLLWLLDEAAASGLGDL